MSGKNVVVALSGGVDSSVAALLLQKSGYDVIGVHMRLWNSPDFDTQAHRAENISRILKIPYYEIDLRPEFELRVVEYFYQEYKQGRTPNPCVVCNQQIKFGFLLEKALSLGANYLVTGHYARIEQFEGRYRLLEATDANKDQSYFLYTLTQERMKHILFPLGQYTKQEVKRMATAAGLPSTTKSSQDLCFVSERNYRAFLSQRFPSLPGDIVDREGRKLGQHKGIALYTIGQRQGLGIALGKPVYVVRIEPECNRIVVGFEEDLYCKELCARCVSWVSGKVPSYPVAVMAKIRYRSKAAEALVYSRNGSVDVRFSEAQKAVTPGQAIVFYKEDEVLGGGIIYRAGKYINAGQE